MDGRDAVWRALAARSYAEDAASLWPMALPLTAEEGAVVGRVLPLRIEVVDGWRRSETADADASPKACCRQAGSVLAVVGRGNIG